MGSRFLALMFALLLTCHISYAAIFDPTIGCRCAKVRSRFIPPSQYESVSIFPPGSACNKMEVIITIREKGTKVCVNPEVKWVQNLVKIVKGTQKSAAAAANRRL
ncbi:C-X-C motif chemokine 13 [Podarcis muralis]